MPTMAVLGATGYTGRLVVAEALKQGHRPHLLGRDLTALQALDAAARQHERDQGSHGDHLDRPLPVVQVDVEDPQALRAALEPITVLITLVGPFDQLGRRVLDAAIDTHTDHVDVSGEQPFLRWLFDEREASLREADVVAVPSAGFDFLPGDLLASIAAGAVSWPQEVHVAYTIPKASRRVVSAGTRRTIASMLGRDGIALDHGELVTEGPFEARRLAWFPRPVGPQHAAGFPGAEPLTVPRHVPGVSTVRTYLAMPSARAEFAQMAATVARWPKARRLAQRFLEGGPTGPSTKVREATRWGCVAETRGDEGVARSWAYGHDVYGFTAVAVVVVAERLLQHRPEPGVRSPAQLGVASELLDVLAARSDMRWSIARPPSDDMTAPEGR